MRVGAAKVSDHHVRSPLLNINRACQPCHKFDETELRARVQANQDRTYAMRNRAMEAVVALINDLAAAKESGRSDAELATARELHRQSQFYVDFVEAENSMGFHAPGEAVRILGTAIDLARQGQLALRGVAPSTASQTNPTGVRPGGDASAPPTPAAGSAVMPQGSGSAAKSGSGAGSAATTGSAAH
jgi:nitrite reductase (cytochrome c-552)